MLLTFITIFLVTTVTFAKDLPRLDDYIVCPDGSVLIDGECHLFWDDKELNVKNVAITPPNCPPGTQWINGFCRDLFNQDKEKSARNMIKAPINCPSDKRAVNYDGSWKCEPVFSESLYDVNGPQNVVTVPPNCPPGQEWINGECVDVWPMNVVTIPPNCPPGQKWVNGKCVDVWPKNVVTVPPNCPPGQVWIGGQCRDVWRMFQVENSKCPDGVMIDGDCVSVRDVLAKIISNIRKRPLAKTIEDDLIMNVDVFGDEFQVDPENRRVINIPNQCPVGFRPDANGVCRPIF